MARVSYFFLVLISLGFFFVTYNLVTMVIHYQSAERDRELIDGGSSTRSYDSQRLNGHKRLFHVALTATDAVYSKWQCRVMYYWYTKMKDREGSEMGGFTRVLHSGSPDNLMEEIPTFVVDPLPEGRDRVKKQHSFRNS